MVEILLREFLYLKGWVYLRIGTYHTPFFPWFAGRAIQSPSLLLSFPTTLRTSYLMNVLSFEDRAQSGRYDQLASLFDGDSESLATVDFGTHFTAKARSWHSGDVKNYMTTFSVVGGETRQELVVNLIGEVTQEGTELRAKGNAWLKVDDVITDKTSAKDVIVLKLPSLATPLLEVLYENQICTLEAVCDAALPAPVVSAPPRHHKLLIADPIP